MAKDFEIHIDEAALRRAAQPGIDRMEREATEKMRATVRQVNAEMSGQPADAVLVELRARLESGLPGFTWNEDKLAEFAEAISAGTLEE